MHKKNGDSWTKSTEAVVKPKNANTEIFILTAHEMFISFLTFGYTHVSEALLTCQAK